MILRPRLQDIKVIGFYLGKVVFGLAFFMILPLGIGLIFREANPTLDFLIALQISLIFGLLLISVCKTDKDLNWMQGMIVVSLSWIVAMLLSAIPLYLSTHYHSYLDACFETMSGFTTTGLTLVQDLDHLSRTHNFWRHLGPFLGGQGMIIVALSLFVRGSSGALKLYVGEGREEKLLPNVTETSRFIWIISIVYLILGTLVLGGLGIFILGFKPAQAFFHGVCIFMAGFDTAGFAPQSQNILYYHSLLYEVTIIVIMIMGALNFNFHYQLWLGKKSEAWKNIESRAFLLSVGLLFFIVAISLQQTGIYSHAITLFRKGFFHLISGHTTTGYMTIYAQQFINEWGSLALAGLILAMGLGGCICSTAGGIKMLRVGIIFKALKEDLKRLILPEKTVVYEKFHHIREIFLDDKLIRAACIITIAYIVLYAIGALIGMYYGYPFFNSLFESVSAAGNVGLSCGITAATMPTALKFTYIFQMWAGRLEFMSVFTLMGFVAALIKGRK